MEEFKSLFFNEKLLAMTSDWLLKLVLALIIFLVGRWVSRLVKRWLTRLMDIQEVDPTLVSFLGNMAYAVLLAATILAALDRLGLPITSLVTVVGAAGLAIGLAMKDSLSNFAAGVMLVMFRPFGEGDFIEASGVTGKVEEIRIFRTVLVTADNRQVIIPNGQVWAGTITNFTAKSTRRIDLVFGVGYDDDLKIAREVLTRVCTSHPKVLSDPAPSVFVLNLGENSVDFAVRPWATTDDHWAVRGDILEQGKVELEAAGCNIPYPQRDVHLYSENND